MGSNNVTNPYLIEDFKRIGLAFESYGLVNQTILVTGATGLIGSIIVRAAIYYNENHVNRVNIIAMARNREKVESIFAENTKGVRFVYQDICDVISCDIKCDYIIHTANPTISKQFITSPVEVIECIYGGTKRVLDYAKESAVKGVVYLSSMEVFGIVDVDRRVSEQELGYIDIHSVRSSYSEGKRLAECMCNSYAKEYDVPVRIARLAQTFGAGVLPGEGRVFAQFVKNTKNSKDIVLHTMGKSIGNYVYTGDAIDAILLLLTRGIPGEAYTVANEKNTMTILELAQTVVNVIGNDTSQIVFDIPDDNQYGYAPDTKLKLSSKKIEGLGWKPFVDMKEAIVRMSPDIN